MKKYEFTDEEIKSVMKKNRDFKYKLEFNEFTPAFLCWFLNSTAEDIWVQGFENWSDVQEFRASILKNPNLGCETYVVKENSLDCYRVKTFDELYYLYGTMYQDKLLYEDNLMPHKDDYTSEEIEEIMAHPDNQCYEGFEDFVRGEYSKEPTEDNINFSFFDSNYIYHVMVKIFKK